MKKIILFLAFFGGVPFAFADLKFGELIQYPTQLRGEYIPFSNNQYGIDTGFFQFPNNVTVLLEEKSKRIYPNPEALPSHEQHTQDVEDSFQWYKEQYEKTGSRSIPFPRGGKDKIGRKKISIPKTDTIMDTLIQKVGEKNFISLLQRGGGMSHGEILHSREIPALKIIGAEYRCEEPRNEGVQEYSPFPLSTLTQGLTYRECWFEEEKEMFLNTHNTRRFLVDSDTEQEITIRIFPVDPGKYKFDRHVSLDVHASIPLALIDPVLDYYDIHMYYSQLDSHRDYQPYTYKLQDRLNKKLASEKTTYNATVIFPYHEITVQLQKGYNSLDIEYYSYTPTDGNAYFIVE